MNDSVLHKKPNFLILELLPFVIFILKFYVEHMSVTTKNISMKRYR